MNACSATTARIGLDRLIVMFQNIVHSPAPSMLADSYNSRGSASKKPLSKKIEYPWARPGSSSAAKVLSRLRSRIIRNTGIWVTIGGNAMVSSINSISLYALGGLYRLSA